MITIILSAYAVIITIAFLLEIVKRGDVESDLQITDENYEVLRKANAERIKELIKLTAKIKELEAEKKSVESVVSFLSEQNMILNSDLKNIDKNSQQKSEIITEEKLRRAFNKFLEALQTSK